MVRATAEELDRVQKAIETLNALKQSAGQPRAAPTATTSAGENKASRTQPNEEIVVGVTAQYVYLQSQPVTLWMLKRKLAEAVGRNPNLNLVVKADRDAPAEQVAGVLETARSLHIEPKSSEMIKLETRVFRVSPATLLEGLKNISGVLSLSGTTYSVQDSIRAFFTAAGVSVQPPNALFYNDRTGVLMVRAPAEEMGFVEKVLETLNHRPRQITIETRFMEIPTKAAGEFGFDLPPLEGASGTWTRIMTAEQTRSILYTAAQRVGVDILSAPKVTTLSGRQTQIQVRDVKSAAHAINPPALAPPGSQTMRKVVARPGIATQAQLGPTLDVLAYVAADGYTVHLSARSQVTDSPQAKAPTPRAVFRTRQMQASGDIYDGQTLVLANPQVTIISKQQAGQSVTNAVPEDASKRLLVFITPTIIDPAGNPIHTPGKEPFPADRIPGPH
jgi:type II secretory pathway component GspD/PulD (secretin)